MRITFIGLGNMGAALVHAHLKAGSRCTIWNRSPDKSIVKELEAAGASYESDLSKAIQSSDHLVICLPDHESVYDCLDGLESTSGTFSHLAAVINLSNGTPKDAEEMSSWLKGRDASVYISGAIMAGPDNIADRETAFILYSGAIPEQLTGDIEGLLAAFGKPDYVGTGVGKAQLINNASLASTYSLFAGALLSSTILLRSAEGDADGVQAHLARSTKMSRSFQAYVSALLRPAVQELDGLAQSVEEGNEDAQGSSVSMIAASVRNLNRTCDELGIDGGGMEHFWRLCREVTSDGDGGKGLASIAGKMMRRT